MKLRFVHLEIAFRKLASVFPPIPRHRFFLQDYTTLYPCLNRVDILTDAIGRISALQQLEPKQINQRVVYKCDVVIQNIRFCDCKEPLEILLPSAIQGNEAQMLQIAKKVTIDELAFLDPDLHKDDTFVRKASVKRFDTRFNWWYSACPNCVKQMHKDPTTGQLLCQKHLNQIPTPWYKVNLILEDETNEMNALIIGKCGEKLFGMPCKHLVLNQRLVEQQQLPNEFLRLIGHKKFFHLRFGNRRNTFNSNDILIDNVIEDTAMQPATPQRLSRNCSVFHHCFIFNFNG